MPDTKKSKFDLNHHGDEVIVSTDSNGEIDIMIKIQTAILEHRSVKLHFQTQTQVERLFSSIMKGIRSNG